MLKPGQLIDRFLVEAEIGRGGMGVVFRVRHIELDSLFALKVVAVNQPGLHARLVQEGRAQARIRHLNVVHVADVLKEAELVGLVMEFVNGPTLDRWLGLRIPAVHEVEDLYLGIVAGVEHAHAAGVIHRDLKARNILLEINASTIVPKVSDFGIARYAMGEGGGDMRLTLDNVPMGTPGYMAPEQVRNARDVDHRADVFALGVLLYRLLCGTTPFDAEDSFEVMDRTVRGDYVPPRRLRNDIPIRMERTILSCLQVDPARRPQSCAEIRDMLKTGAPPRPAPPPPRAPTEGFPLGLEEAWNADGGASMVDAPAAAELRAALAGEGSGSFRRPPDPKPPEAPRPRPEPPLAEAPRSRPEFQLPEAQRSRPEFQLPEAQRSRPDLQPPREASVDPRLADPARSRPDAADAARRAEAISVDLAPRPEDRRLPPTEPEDRRLPPTEPYPAELPPPPTPVLTGSAEVLPADAVPSRLEGAVRSGGVPVLASLALVALITVYFAFQGDQPDPPLKVEPTPVATTPAAEPEPAVAPPPVAEPEPEPAPTPVAEAGKKPRTPRTVAPAPTTTPATPVTPAVVVPVAPTGPAPDEIWLKFKGPILPQQVLLTCNVGSPPQQEVAIVDKSARFSKVDPNARCTIEPKGTTKRFSSQGVRPGNSYVCTLIGDVGTTTCRS